MTAGWYTWHSWTVTRLDSDGCILDRLDYAEPSEAIQAAYEANQTAPPDEIYTVQEHIERFSPVGLEHESYLDYAD